MNAHDAVILGTEPILYYNWDNGYPGAPDIQKDLVYEPDQLDANALFFYTTLSPSTVANPDNLPAWTRITAAQTGSEYGWKTLNDSAFMNLIRPNWPTNTITAYTLSAWYKISAKVTTPQWLCRFSANGMGLYYNNYSPNPTFGQITGMHYAPGAALWNRSGFYSGDEIGIWHHALYTASADFLRVYWNGNKVSEYIAATGGFGPVVMPNKTQMSRFQIGFEESITEAFRGTIGPVTVWNRQLEQDEIETVFNAANPTSPIGMAFAARPVEKRMRPDKIKINRTTTGPEVNRGDLNITIQDVDDDAATSFGSLFRIGDTLLYQSAFSNSPVISTVHAIDSTGDVFTADFSTPVATVTTTETALNQGSGLAVTTGVDWFLYGVPHPVSTVKQREQFVHLSLTDDDPVTVDVDPAISVLPVDETNHLNWPHTAVGLDDTHLAVVRADGGTMESVVAPKLHLLQWGGATPTLTVRASTTFGATRPFGEWDPNSSMWMQKISPTQFMIIWEDDYEEELTESSMYAQVVTFDTTAGTLTPHPHVRLPMGLVEIDDWVYWEEKRLLLLAGFNNDFTDAFAQVIHINGNTPESVNTQAHLFNADEGDTVYSLTLVGQDGVYAVIYSQPALGPDVAEWDSDIWCKKFYVGDTGRDFGAIRPYDTSLIFQGGAEDHEMFGMSGRLGPIQWSENKTIGMYEHYRGEDWWAYTKMVVAEKV